MMLTTTVVGSHPQPDWLVDRALLAKGVPRVRMESMWRIPGPFLEQAQDDATIVAIREMERAGIDIVTDGEIRRESYSNRFATALDGVDVKNPGYIRDHYGNETPVPPLALSRNGASFHGNMSPAWSTRKVGNTTKVSPLVWPGPK